MQQQMQQLSQKATHYEAATGAISQADAHVSESIVSAHLQILPKACEQGMHMTIAEAQHMVFAWLVCSETSAAASQ
jgi:hypothetical protein